jgi:ankyrin repeat protein
MVLMLLRYGADVNARAQPVNTGIMAISDTIHAEWYEAPLKTPLFAAAAKGHADVIQVLLAHGADIHARDDWGGTPLHRAAGEGQTRSAEVLLEAGADVNALDSYQRTPLCWAVERDGTSRWSMPVFRWDTHETVESTRVVELLLLRGANPNVSDNTGGTPLHWAADRGTVDIARLLLAKGAKVDATMRSEKVVARPAGRISKGGPGQTPLHIAARRGDNASLLALLLAAGADPNKATTGPARDRDFQTDLGTVPPGTTPLHFASLIGDPDAVRALLDGGADPNRRDAEGKLPADRASDSRVRDLLRTRTSAADRPR